MILNHKLRKTIMLMKKNERSEKFKINSLILLFSQVSSIAISFVLVPLTLNYLGKTEYAVWITLVALIEWLNLFDIGIGHGLRNKYAESMAANNHQEAVMFVSTAFFIMLFVSAGIFLISVPLISIINWAEILNASIELSNSLRSLALILVVIFCIKFVVNIVCVILTADQRPALPALANVAGSMLALISTFLFTRTPGNSIFFIGSGLAISQLIPLVFLFLYCFSTRYKKIIPRWSFYSKNHIKSIFTLGSQFFLIQITTIVLLQSNNIIIAHVCGLKEVTDYNIAFKYVNILLTMFMVLLTPLWSATTDSYFRGDIPWIVESYKKLNKLWILMVFVAVFMFFLSPFFYKLWIGNTMVPNMGLIFILLLNSLFQARSLLYRSFMNGIGKIKLQFLVTFLQSSVHIPLAIYLGKTYGILGVASTLLIWNFSNSIWEQVQYNKIISNNAKGVWFK